MRSHSRHRWSIAAAAVGIALVLTGCRGSTTQAAATVPPSSVAASESAPITASAVPAPAAEPPPAASRLRGNAATNPACKLLTVNQVATTSGLSVNGVFGLESDTTNPAKHSEQCTWFLESKDIQASLVVQYTVFAKPPSELTAYYKQMSKQGFATIVPDLGDIAKIKGHVLDAVYKRASISVTLLTHAEATAEDQAAAIQFMRLVMPAIV